MHEDEPTPYELAETHALLEILRLAEEDIAAGRTIPAETVFAELRRKLQDKSTGS